MTTEQKPRPRGRPRNPVVEGARYQLTARLTPRTREKMEEAAARNGRSLVQEAEARLERSFRDEELLGGAQTADVLLMLGRIIKKIEEDTGKPWRRDYGTAMTVNMAAFDVLRAYSPPPPDDEDERLASLDLLDLQNEAIDPETAGRINELRKKREREYDFRRSLWLGMLSSSANGAD